MKFYDKVQIVVQSGKGGDGAASARREAGVPYGGPNGGNGGHGGSVIFQADSNYNTLLHLRFQKEREAKPGFPGESADKYGKSAEDLIIPVPVGTIIKVVENSDAGTEDIEGERDQEEEEDFGEEIEDNKQVANSKQQAATIVYHFTEHNEQFVICKGGIGGAGNMHFKNSLVQYPDFSLFGEPGQRKTVEIELQLLADVGLIGMPSVGKSSIINSISNSKAKVAEYHFTTLVPNLGSVKWNDESRNIIDIPGIVEGASEGKGLGNEFLRHVLKARLFAFVMDISRWDEGIKEFGTLRDEIIAYIESRFAGSQEFGYGIDQVHFDLKQEGDQIVLSIFDQEERLLLQKGIVWIVNKIDEAMDEEVLGEYRAQLIAHVETTFKRHKFKISGKAIERQIVEYSTILDQLKKKLLQFMYEKLQNIEEYVVHFDAIAASSLLAKRSIELVGSLDEEEVQDLLAELGYQFQLWEKMLIEELHLETDKEENSSTDPEASDEEDGKQTDVKANDKESTQAKKLRRIYEKEVARLGYQLPWGKVLAEERFWRVMKQQGIHRWLNKSGVATGDILWVVSDYDSNKHIVFPYMLSDGKTSYKHQKIT